MNDLKNNSANASARKQTNTPKVPKVGRPRKEKPKQTVDFYAELREKMISDMQDSMAQIRKILGYTTIDFSDMLGVTRQTLNNLEAKRIKLTVTQYLAICAVIDNAMSEDETLRPAVMRLLTDPDKEDPTDGNSTLLKRWFLCYPDNSGMLYVPKDPNSITEENMRSFAENYKIFIDGSFLSNESADIILNRLNPYMIAFRNKYFISMRIIEEMQDGLMSFDRNIQEKYRNGMTKLRTLQDQKLIAVRSGKNDTTVIGTYLAVFAKFKYSNRILLITQDETMADRISELNKDGVGGFNILIMHIAVDSDEDPKPVLWKYES